MKKNSILTAFLIGILLVLFSCGKKEVEENEAVQSALEGNALSMILGAELKSFDPAETTDMVGIRVLSALFEGLTVYNEQTLLPEPGVARSWNISDDGKTYTFELEDTTWSNGDPVKPGHFVYAWKRVLEPASGAPYAYMLFPIKNAQRYNQKRCKWSDVGIKAEEHKLIITLERPTAHFLALTSFVTYYPVNPSLVELYKDKWTNPEHFMGNGPFVMDKYVTGDSVDMKKNLKYHRAGDVKLDRLLIRFIESQNTGYEEYVNGKADIFTSLPSQIFKKIKDSGQKDLHIYDMLGTYFIRFNVRKRPFNDKRVRKAIALAIDSSFIVDKITAAGETPAKSFVPVKTTGASDFAAEETFDPKKAKELLAQAGYSKKRPFPKIEYLYNTAEDHKMIANALADMLKNNLGIEMTPLNMEWKVYLKKMKDIKYDLCRSAWIADYDDPISFLNLWMSRNGNNRTGWSNKNYDKLIPQIEQEMDPVKRKELIAQAEKILYDEMPIIPLHFYRAKMMYNPDIVGGLYPNLMSWIRPGKLYKKQP